MSAPIFGAGEFHARIAQVRREMERREIGIALISSPENIFYLTGLDHWGYFAPHMLILPADVEPALVTRAMERVTIANQVGTARFSGHADSETVADVVIRELRTIPARGHIGMEAWSSGLPLGLATTIRNAFPDARWADVTGLVDDIRAAAQMGRRANLRVADPLAAPRSRLRATSRRLRGHDPAAPRTGSTNCRSPLLRRCRTAHTYWPQLTAWF
jgi:Xaa-Pro dipeptidase